MLEKVEFAAALWFFIVGTYVRSCRLKQASARCLPIIIYGKGGCCPGFWLLNAGIICRWRDRLSQYGCFARDGGRRCDFPISDMPDCPSVQNPVVYKALTSSRNLRPQRGRYVSLWYFIVCSIIGLTCPVFWDRACLIRLFVFNILKYNVLCFLFVRVVWCV